MSSTDATGVFQLDLWARDKVERAALRAAVPGLFRTADYPSTVIVDAPDAALPRMWRGTKTIKVYLTLAGLVEDVDDPSSAERNEWQATAKVEWSTSVVVAVDATPMEIIAQAGRVLEAGTITAVEEV